jgi:hypothetical protein
VQRVLPILGVRSEVGRICLERRLWPRGPVHVGVDRPIQGADESGAQTLEEDHLVAAGAQTREEDRAIALRDRFPTKK